MNIITAQFEARIAILQDKSATMVDGLTQMMMFMAMYDEPDKDTTAAHAAVSKEHDTIQEEIKHLTKKLKDNPWIQPAAPRWVVSEDLPEEKGGHTNNSCGITAIQRHCPGGRQQARDIVWKHGTDLMKQDMLSGNPLESAAVILIANHLGRQLVIYIRTCEGLVQLEPIGTGRGAAIHIVYEPFGVIMSETTMDHILKPQTFLWHYESYTRGDALYTGGDNRVKNMYQKMWI